MANDDVAVKKPPHKSQDSFILANKRYFTIGEVSDICGVETYILRYWEQEFLQLKPVRRRGNRRYYQPKDIEIIQMIRHLLYEQGYTICGAKRELTQYTNNIKTVATYPCHKKTLATHESQLVITMITELENILNQIKID